MILLFLSILGWELRNNFACNHVSHKVGGISVQEQSRWTAILFPSLFRYSRSAAILHVVHLGQIPLTTPQCRVHTFALLLYLPWTYLHLRLKVSTDNNYSLGSLCGHFIKRHSVRPIYYAGLSYHKISSGQSPVGHQDPARLWRISQDILWIFLKVFFRYLFWLLAILWTGERVWPKLCYYLFSGGLVHMPWGSSKGLGIKSLNM